MTRNRNKIYYTLEWGKKAGQRIATGIFTYTFPANPIQKSHNKEALRFLQMKKAQMTLDWLAVGTASVPAHRYHFNFLDFYEEYVRQNKQTGNRHLQSSYGHFKNFLNRSCIPPIDVTEDLSARFRQYLLDHFNGETPANYFARYKRVLKSATSQGYFKASPALSIPAKANKNKRRKNNLEAEEYLQLLRAPATNEEVKEAFIFCCYTGLRWCNIKLLAWRHVTERTLVFTIFQRKTSVEVYITIHPVAQAILDHRRIKFEPWSENQRIFRLPTAEGANKVLGQWSKSARIEKHITWSCARLSFSILLQDARIDTATVALLLGHTSTRYVHDIYRRYRPKDQNNAIQMLPPLPAEEKELYKPALFQIWKFKSEVFEPNKLCEKCVNS